MTELQGRRRILAAAEWAEGLPISLGRWLLFLAAIIVLRHFLEQSSGHKKTLYFLSYFIHYPLAYVAPLLALSVLLAAFARERIERVSRLMLFAWLLTLLPPLLDIALPRSAETPQLIGYLLPRSSTLTSAFINLFNPSFHSFQGTTAGIRIEAAFGCVLGAFYVHLKTRSAVRTVASFFAIYVTMFFFFALPPIVFALARLLGAGEIGNVYAFFFAKGSVYRAFVNATPFGVSDLSTALIDLLIIFPIVWIWYRLYDRARLASLAARVSIPQVSAHVLATAAGIVLGAKLLLPSRGAAPVAHPFDVVSLAGLVAASAVTALAAGVLRATSRETARPDERRELVEIGAILFSFAALFALSVSYVALTYVLAAMAAYYLYYAPPFRLARFAIVSGFTVGAAILFMVTLGYAAYAGAAASLWLPASITGLCLLVPTLALFARDVWEPAGTESERRFRLSGHIAGPRLKTLAGIAAAAAAVLPGAFLESPPLLVLGAAVGVAAFFIVARLAASRVPLALTALATVFVVAAFPLARTRVPFLSRQLTAAGFGAEGVSEGAIQPPGGGETPAAASSPLGEGMRRFQQGDYEGAAEVFRSVTESEPDNVTAYVSLGTAYLRLNRLSEAVRAFRKAIDLDDRDANAHLGLGQTYQLSGDHASAIDELTTALRLAPSNPVASYSLALVYEATGDTDLEIEMLERTIASDPKYSLAEAKLGEVYLANGMYEQAIAPLRAAAEGRVPIAHIHARLAEAYYRSGNLESAENQLRLEIAENPKSPSPRAVLAQILIEQRRFGEARNELGTAISLTGDEALRARLEDELQRIEGK